MKLALNGATTMKADLATDIKVAGAAGFDYVEIWAAKLRDYLQAGTTGELAALFRENGVAPYSINSIENVTFRTSEARAELLFECDQLCRIASEIACPFVVVVPGRLPDGATREEVVDESVRILRQLGEVAEGFGVSLAFEFLGQPGCSVQTLSLADAIVRDTARNNVGLVLDSFHFYAGGSTIESIEALDPECLYVFHVNDAEDLPREQLDDRHRLLPGLGILPLAEIIAALRRIGYDRVTSVEIFRPEYWQRDPLALARDARAAVADVLGLA
ncbi:MAG TPA: sugar phosphate isomerase/epimerase [Blastocatellia bacterium]|nr:sugar phosphate isomerase/epimerase [Blastocatellia bacterium]